MDLTVALKTCQMSDKNCASIGNGPVEKVYIKAHFLNLEAEKIGFQKLFAKNRKFELVHLNGRWLVS